MAGQPPYTGTIFRAPDGELYYVLDESPGTFYKLEPPDKAEEAKALFKQYFSEEGLWVPAVHGAFLGPGRPPGPCCATLLKELENALQGWRAKQRK